MAWWNTYTWVREIVDMVASTGMPQQCSNGFVGVLHLASCCVLLWMLKLSATTTWLGLES